jgi:hypothetical protein
LQQLTTTLARLLRLARFDLDVLDEVRLDGRATRPALAVAIASMLLFGLGGWLWYLRTGWGSADEVLLKSALLGTLFSAALWLVWLLVVVAVLQHVARVRVAVDQLLHAAGFATLPLVLGLLIVVPGVGFGAGLLALGGWLLTTQAAIERCAPDAGGHALLANLAGFAVWLGAMSLLAMEGDPLAPGPFLADAVWDSISFGD